MLNNSPYELSLNESKIFGLNFYRFRLENPRGLLNGIRKLIHSKGDIVRIKTSLPSSRFNQFCANIPLLYGSTTKVYEVLLNTFPNQKLNNPEADYILYDASLKSDIIRLTREIYIDNPLGYHQIPILKNFITKNQEIKALTQHLLAFTDFKKSKKQMWLIRYQNQFVGFTTSEEISPGITEASYAGVIKKYRNNNFFSDIIRFNQNTCRNLGYHTIYTAGRMDSHASTYTFEKENCNFHRYDYNYFIPLFIEKNIFLFSKEFKVINPDTLYAELVNLIIRKISGNRGITAWFYWLRKTSVKIDSALAEFRLICEDSKQIFVSCLVNMKEVNVAIFYCLIQK